MTDSERFTHKVVKRLSISLAQDRESSPARTDVLTTMLHHQLAICLVITQRMRLIMRLSSTIMEIWRLKDNGVTTLTFWGHVTS